MVDPRTTPDPVPPPQRAGRSWGWIVGIIAVIAILWLVFEMWDTGDDAVVDAPAAEELLSEDPLDERTLEESAAEQSRLEQNTADAGDQSAPAVAP